MPKGFTRQNFSQKNLVGFTLLELLIVIGILAILSTTMIMVINPAEMLKRARDSQRISDLNTLKNAISFYLFDDSTPSMGTSSATYIYTYAGGWASSVKCSTGNNYNTPSQAINSSGWIPIDFTSISGGSPIAALPIDPNPASSTSGHFYYVYVPASNNSYVLLAEMESVTYRTGGPNDVEGKDGGSLPGVYEVGTNLSIVTATSATCFAY